MKKSHLVNMSLLLYCFSQHLPAGAESFSWKKIKDQQGIQIYTIDSAKTDIVKAKAVTEINASIQQIQAVLDDVVHRNQWIPYLKTSRVVSDYADNKRLEYSLFTTPWPASNRDFLYQIEMLEKTDNKIVYKMKSVISDLVPESRNMIRAELVESIYILTSVNEGTTRVELVFHANPKGWIPDWIVNIVQSVFPFRTLVNLKNRVLSLQNIE